MKRGIGICYLCGQKLEGDIDGDHVPPKQVYSRIIRRRVNLNLFILPTHRACNKSYKDDEEYFVHSLAPLAVGSDTGRALWAGNLDYYKKDLHGKRLGEMIMGEFANGKIILPSGKTYKTVNRNRIDTILWKITRGLFFKEQRRFLPQNKLEGTKCLSPDERPPEVFNGTVLVTEPMGDYPIVFDYKRLRGQMAEGTQSWIWAMLFWDVLMMFVVFHDPACACPKCESSTV